MFALNGNRQRVYGMVFVMLDSLFVLAGVFGAIFIRFSRVADYFYSYEYAPLRIMLMAFLIQLSFYFFDLYDPRLYYGERKKILISLLGSFGTSSVLIFVVYYLMPSVQIGRGLFTISLILIFIFSFSWRVLYASIFKSGTFTERVLIIGTGTLAQKIKKELTNNGYHGFEIIGFIDENGQRTERRI